MKTKRGFSILELLAVMTIIILVGALVGPPVQHLLRSVHLTQATQTIIDELSVARQIASSRNTPVEVRLYRYAETSEKAKEACFRAIQLYWIGESGAIQAIDRLHRLPKSTLLDSGVTLSSLLDTNVLQLQTGSGGAINGGSFEYITFQIRPDGSTNLNPEVKWFLTVHNRTDGDQLTVPPGNFTTIEIDPLSSALTIYRP